MKTIRTLMLLTIIGMVGTAWAQPLKILCDSDPPAQFIGADGQLTGYTVELVRDIQKRVGNDDPISIVPWARGYEMIRHQPNVVLFLMAHTPERASQFKWVGPVLELEFGFYARSDSKPRRPVGSAYILTMRGISCWRRADSRILTARVRTS